MTAQMVQETAEAERDGTRMKARRLRTSVRLNNDVGVAEFVELAQIAEAGGIDQIWVSNDMFFHSAPVMLAAAAVATRSIGLGTCVLNPYSMHPAEIAMVCATMQELSGDRFLLGLAAGAADMLGWAGITRDAPLRRTAEAVVAIRSLCAGGAPADTTDSGAGWQPEGRLRLPARPTPVYLGAMSPRMHRLAGSLADGALPLLYPPESFGEVMANIAEGAIAAGRDPDDLDVAACVWVSIGDDPEVADRRLADKLVYFGPSFSPTVLDRVGVTAADLAPLRSLDPDDAARALPAAMMSLGISGSPDAVVERCRGLLDAGARHLSFGPPLGDDRRLAIRLLAEHVVPALRGGDHANVR